MSKDKSESSGGEGLRIAVVTSRFNEFVTTRLLTGAREALTSQGVRAEDIAEYWVPGAWELPLAAQELAKTGRFDALVCLGCVIRGETTHHLHVGGEAARGLADVSLQTGVPIGFGVLTTENVEQATARAGGREGNKGADAALAALEMARWVKKMRT